MDYLTAQQVVVILGISENTLNFWYRFKRENPENEIAKLLPDYIKKNEKSKRYWKRTDLDKLIKFQQSLPKGRNGIMGGITQRYKKEDTKNGKKSANRSTGNRKNNTKGRKKPTKPAQKPNSGVRA